MKLSIAECYQELGLPPGSPLAEAKYAYRRLTAQWHPDRNPGNNEEATEKFKRISVAYEQLRAHLSTGDADDSTPGASRPHRHHDATDGRNVAQDISISILQSVQGAEIPVTVNDPGETRPCCECGGSKHITGWSACVRCEGRGWVKKRGSGEPIKCRACQGAGDVLNQACPACDGLGIEAATRVLNIRIPPGVLSGSVVRIKGAGEKGRNGGSNGDLMLRVEVKPGKSTRVEGLDLHKDLVIDCFTALVGGAVDVSAPTGNLSIVIPCESGSGRILRVPAKGLFDGKNDVRGDLLLKIIIDIPKVLAISDHEREILGSLQRRHRC